MCVSRNAVRDVCFPSRCLCCASCCTACDMFPVMCVRVLSCSACHRCYPSRVFACCTRVAYQVYLHVVWHMSASGHSPCARSSQMPCEAFSWEMPRYEEQSLEPSPQVATPCAQVCSAPEPLFLGTMDIRTDSELGRAVGPLSSHPLPVCPACQGPTPFQISPCPAFRSESSQGQVAQL